MRTNIREHAAGISTYKFSGKISNAVSIIRGKKEMFGKNKIVKNKTTILYIKMFVCLFAWNLYKSTFLNRSEPNFAHISLLVWRRW
jgi:hypothetical protein